MADVYILLWYGGKVSRQQEHQTLLAKDVLKQRRLDIA